MDFVWNHLFWFSKLVWLLNSKRKKSPSSCDRLKRNGVFCVHSVKITEYCSQWKCSTFPLVRQSRRWIRKKPHGFAKEEQKKIEICCILISCNSFQLFIGIEHTNQLFCSLLFFISFMQNFCKKFRNHVVTQNAPFSRNFSLFLLTLQHSVASEWCGAETS